MATFNPAQETFANALFLNPTLFDFLEESDEDGDVSIDALTATLGILPEDPLALVRGEHILPTEGTLSGAAGSDSRREFFLLPPSGQTPVQAAASNIFCSLHFCTDPNFSTGTVAVNTVNKLRKHSRMPRICKPLTLTIPTVSVAANCFMVSSFCLLPDGGTTYYVSNVQSADTASAPSAPSVNFRFQSGDHKSGSKYAYAQLVINELANKNLLQKGKRTTLKLLPLQPGAHNVTIEASVEDTSPITFSINLKGRIVSLESIEPPNFGIDTNGSVAPGPVRVHPRAASLSPPAASAAAAAAAAPVPAPPRQLIGGVRPTVMMKNRNS